jgi:hypothetical protein
MMEHFAWTVSMSSSSSGASFIPFLQILLKEKKTQHSVCIAFISAHFNIVYGLLVVLRNAISTEPYILLLFSQLCPGEISNNFLIVTLLTSLHMIGLIAHPVNISSRSCSFGSYC